MHIYSGDGYSYKQLPHDDLSRASPSWLLLYVYVIAQEARAVFLYFGIFIFNQNVVTMLIYNLWPYFWSSACLKAILSPLIKHSFKCHLTVFSSSKSCLFKEPSELFLTYTFLYDINTIQHTSFCACAAFVPFLKQKATCDSNVLLKC